MSYKNKTIDDVLNNAALNSFQSTLPSGTIIHACTLEFAIETMLLFDSLQMEKDNLEPINQQNLATLISHFQMAWGVNNCGSTDVTNCFNVIYTRVTNYFS